LGNENDECQGFQVSIGVLVPSVVFGKEVKEEVVSDEET